eukprot:7552056-Pyramimonas_sp.AAC.1
MPNSSAPGQHRVGQGGWPRVGAASQQGRGRPGMAAESHLKGFCGGGWPRDGGRFRARRAQG